MKSLPVAISLIVSFQSSIMMVGLPAESYVYGLQYIWSPIGYFVVVVLGVFAIVPVLYPLKLTTAYEYLEMRFQCKHVRTLGNPLFIIYSLFYMGVVLFGPAVALEKSPGFLSGCRLFLSPLQLYCTHLSVDLKQLFGQTCFSLS